MEINALILTYLLTITCLMNASVLVNVQKRLD